MHMGNEYSRDSYLHAVFQMSFTVGSTVKASAGAVAETDGRAV